MPRCDSAYCRDRVWASSWRRFLTRLEPSPGDVEVTDADLERRYLGGEAPNMHAVLDGALGVDLWAAGLDIRSRLTVANGRAQVLIAGPQNSGVQGTAR